MLMEPVIGNVEHLKPIVCPKGNEIVVLSLCIDGCNQVLPVKIVGKRLGLADMLRVGDKIEAIMWLNTRNRVTDNGSYLYVDLVLKAFTKIRRNGY